MHCWREEHRRYLNFNPGTPDYYHPNPLIDLEINEVGEELKNVEFRPDQRGVDEDQLETLLIGLQVRAPRYKHFHCNWNIVLRPDWPRNAKKTC